MTESDGNGGWIPVWYRVGEQLCYWWPTPTVNGMCTYCGMTGSMHERISDEELKTFFESET